MDISKIKSMDDIIEAERALEERKAELALGEAQELYDALMGILERMERINAVPGKIRDVLTDKSGTFSPTRFLKRPR